MSTKTALITLSGIAESIACEPTQSAIEARDGILAAARTVLAIADAEQLQVAGDVLREVDAFINRVEAGRKTVKEPVLTVGRMIDDTAKTLTLELGDEKKRLRDIIGKFQAEQERLRAQAERAAREQEEKIRRETEAALAIAQASARSEKAFEKKAAVIEQNAVEDIVNVRAAAAAVAVPKLAGFQTREEIEVKIIDLTELWMHSPECVELSPRLAIIKAKAKAGIELAGVEIIRNKVAVIGGAR